jgi:hypothetical protein
MKKPLILLFMVYGASKMLIAPIKSQTAKAQQQVVCPSGDKYICLDSHDELGTIYRGKGRVIVIQ